MKMMIRNGPGQTRSKKKVWTMAAIVGLIVLAAIAAVYAYDMNGNPGGGSGTAATVAVTPAIPANATHAEQHSGRIDPATITVPTPLTVPDTGIFVVVRYPGAFTGSWQADSASHDIRSSGDRLFTVENSGQTVTAEFKKADRSLKQNLMVEIWKDGKILATGTAQDLFGETRVESPV